MSIELKPGWLQRQCDNVNREVAQWPEWMKREAGVMGTETDRELTMHGVQLIRHERERQQASEGWTASHDDLHEDGEMAEAAVCYIQKADEAYPPFGWPWDTEWWKPSPRRVRNLVKAGALIAAEIDRLLRKDTNA